MSAPARVRLAVGVFLLFGAVGLLMVLMQSNLDVLGWRFILVQTFICGATPACIVLFAFRRRWLIGPIIIFWSLAAFENSGGLSIIVTESGSVRTEFSQQMGVRDGERTKEITTPVTVQPGTLRAIYEQRTFVGLLAMGCIILGYILMTRVIRGEIRHRARLETEVTIARDIQLSLIRKTSLVTPWCTISGCTVPATEVGGDYFDFTEIPGGSVAVCIADVTGHGVGAGILSAMTKSAFHSQVQNDSSPEALCKNLNRTLFRLSTEKMFVTFAYIRFDEEGKRAAAATAGHQPILHRSGDTVTPVRTPSLALGLRSDASYKELPVAIRTGDMFLLYTDGIVEAANPKGEQFGADRLVEHLRGYTGQPEQYPPRLVEALKSFHGSDTFEDDVSCVVVGVHHSADAV